MGSCAKKFKFAVSGKITEFVDINDDCIDTIFRWLSLDDLASISATCEKFHQLAGEYFQRKFPENQIGLRLLDTGIDHETGERYQDNFIAFVRNLKIAAHSNGVMPMFQYLKWNCCENLRELEFYWMNFEADVSYGDGVKDQLSNLESIAFISCSIADLYGMFLKHCDNLKHLTVKDGFAPLQKYFDRKWTKRTLSNLQSVTYYIDHDQYRDDLREFLKLNPQINTLACTGVNVMQTTFQNVIDHISLRFYKESEFLSVFNELKTLSSKKIQLIFDNPLSPEAANLLKSLGSLEAFQILHFTYAPDIHTDEQFYSLLLSLEHLKIFHLKFDDLSEKDMINISMNLPQLQELHLRQFHGNTFRIFRANGLKNFLMPLIQNSKNLRKIILNGLKANDSIELIANDPNSINDLVKLKGNKAITIYFDYEFIWNIKFNVIANGSIDIRPLSELKRDHCSNEWLQFI